MFEIIFDITRSEIDHIKRHSSFKDWAPDGKLDYDNNPNAYFEYEKHTAQPAIDWCEEQNLNFEVENAEYAMRLAFIFKNECDAMAFKLRWL